MITGTFFDYWNYLTIFTILATVTKLYTKSMN